MENMWSYDSIIDERRLGTIQMYLFYFLLFFTSLVFLFFWFYPIEDTYMTLGRSYEKEGEHYIECLFSIQNISYLEKKKFYYKEKPYSYEVVSMVPISEKEGKVIIKYRGKIKESVMKVVWKKGKNKMGRILMDTFRKESYEGTNK